CDRRKSGAYLGRRADPMRDGTPDTAASPASRSRRREEGRATDSVVRPMAYAVAAWSLPKRKSVPSIHMRCSTIASFLANATVARPRPRRLAIAIAQRFKLEKLFTRVSMEWAAS